MIIYPFLLACYWVPALRSVSAAFPLFLARRLPQESNLQTCLRWNLRAQLMVCWPRSE